MICDWNWNNLFPINLCQEISHMHRYLTRTTWQRRVCICWSYTRALFESWNLSLRSYRVREMSSFRARKLIPRLCRRPCKPVVWSNSTQQSRLHFHFCENRTDSAETLLCRSLQTAGPDSGTTEESTTKAFKTFSITLEQQCTGNRQDICQLYRLQRWKVSSPNIPAGKFMQF